MNIEKENTKGRKILSSFEQKFKILFSLHQMISTYLLSAALGISLAACCGFRIFVPLLIASVAAKLGWLPVSSGFEWLGTFPAIISFSVASVLEIAAYYVPVLDNFLDTLTSPSSVVAGTTIAASAFVDFDPMLKWMLAIIAGGGTAGVVQAGTGLLRLGSTKFTAGFGNHFVASAENAFSLIGSMLSIFVPVLMFFVFAGLLATSLYWLITKTKRQ